MSDISSLFVAHLQATDLHVPLPEGWFYHDEGAIVQSIFLPREVPTTIPSKVKKLLAEHDKRRLIEMEGVDPVTAEEQANA